MGSGFTDRKTLVPGTNLRLDEKPLRLLSRVGPLPPFVVSVCATASLIVRSSSPRTSPRASASRSNPAMAREKFYAVARGRVPGVYRSWDEASRQVTSYSGAVHKSFGTHAEAARWVEEQRGILRDEPARADPDPPRGPGGSARATSARDALAASARLPPDAADAGADADADAGGGVSGRPEGEPLPSEPLGPHTLFFDGACRGNPGPSGAGALLRRDADDAIVFELAEYLGDRWTNNEAEYAALTRGLRVAADLGVTKNLRVRGDSALVVNQVAGTWKVKRPNLAPLHEDARAIIDAHFGGEIDIAHVDRERNREADALANVGITVGASVGEGVNVAPKGGPGRGGLAPAAEEIRSAGKKAEEGGGNGEEGTGGGKGGGGGGGGGDGRFFRAEPGAAGSADFFFHPPPPREGPANVHARRRRWTDRDPSRDAKALGRRAYAAAAAGGDAAGSPRPPSPARPSVARASWKRRRVVPPGSEEETTKPPSSSERRAFPGSGEKGDEETPTSFARRGSASFLDEARFGSATLALGGRRWGRGGGAPAAPGGASCASSRNGLEGSRRGPTLGATSGAAARGARGVGWVVRGPHARAAAGLAGSAAAAAAVGATAAAAARGRAAGLRSAARLVGALRIF